MTYNNIKKHKMTDYSKGKIYKIEPICEHEEGEIYIGSTIKDTLAQRMSSHRANYKIWKSGAIKTAHIRSFDLFDKFGIENCKIYLIELFPCNSRDELNSREGTFIRTLKCVNKAIAGGQDYVEYKRQWYEKNKERNKERNCQLKKVYRETNKLILNEKAKVKMQCICGSECRIADKSKHYRTKKHQNYILNNPQET